MSLFYDRGVALALSNAAACRDDRTLSFQDARDAQAGQRLEDGR